MAGPRSTFWERKLDEVGEDGLSTVVGCSFGELNETEGVCDDGQIGRDFAKGIDFFLGGNWVLLILQRSGIDFVGIFLWIGLAMDLDHLIGYFTWDDGIGDAGFVGWSSWSWTVRSVVGREGRAIGDLHILSWSGAPGRLLRDRRIQALSDPPKRMANLL